MSLSTKTSRFMKSLDLFGVHPSLYFQGKLRSGTNFGFFLSILLVTFTSICIVYFGNDLFYRRNPRILSRQKYSPFPEKIVLDPERMPIAIEINSPLGDIYHTNPKILYLTVNQLTIIRNADKTNVTIEQYPMEICAKDHFSKLNKQTQRYFLRKNLSNYFCIPRSLKNLTMQGALDQDLFQQIKFSVMMCSNDTGKTTCLPKEEIEKTMGRGFIGINFVDFTINPHNYQNPKKSQPKEIFTNFVLKSQKEIVIFLKNNYCKTEDGLVFEANHVEKISSFAESSESSFRTETAEFLVIYFRIKQENDFYERSYMKLQDLLAQIGGFLNCFWIIALGINHFYSNLFIICQTISSIFTIKISSEENKKHTLKYLANYIRKFEIKDQKIYKGNSENLISRKGIHINAEETSNDDKKSAKC